MYSLGLELTTPSSWGRRSNHFAMKDSRFGQSILPIYRQPILKINFNTDKTVSRQSDCGKKCRNCQNELARLSALRCPLNGLLLIVSGTFLNRIKRGPFYFINHIYSFIKRYSILLVIKAILRLFIYKALYDQSYLGSKTTMTTGEWSCLISFAWDPLTCSEGRGGSEKFKIKNICL